jgi:hypothetical protein
MIGVSGITNPVLEREVRQRARDQTEKARTAKLERAETDKRKMIAVDCANAAPGNGREQIANDERAGDANKAGR